MGYCPQNERKHKLLLDYDVYGNPNLKNASDLLEIIRLDALRFLGLCPGIVRIVIKRSMQGYHLKTVGPLTREEVDWLRSISHADTGFRFWSRERGKSTLRIGIKPILVKVGEKFVGKRTVNDIPQIIEVIERNGRSNNA